MTPETCRVTWQRINVYILSHRVGPLLTYLWYVIVIFECYINIGVFEEAGYFSHFRTIVCKCGQFRVILVFLIVWFLAGSVTLYLLFEVGYRFVGKVVITCNGVYGFPLVCPSFFLWVVKREFCRCNNGKLRVYVPVSCCHSKYSPHAASAHTLYSFPSFKVSSQSI